MRLLKNSTIVLVLAAALGGCVYAPVPVRPVAVAPAAVYAPPPGYATAPVYAEPVYVEPAYRGWGWRDGWRYR